MVLTTGTTTGPDRGARILARSVRAIRAAVPGLPIQVQCEPPADLAWIGELHAAGATAIGIHAECLDDRVRRAWMPGKSTVPLARYDEAWDEAVRVFGRNRVSTYLLGGLGEDPDELLATATRIGGRYMGEDRAEEFGRRNGVPGELIVRLTPASGLVIRIVTRWTSRSVGSSRMQAPGAHVPGVVARGTAGAR